MNEIKVLNHPPRELLDGLGVDRWPIWEHEAAAFPWRYDAEETCLLLEGEVTVTPENGDPVRFGAGDLVTFPAGMSCTWEIHKAVRKHYTFS